MRSFSITTLGCKVNQYESDHMAQELRTRGFTPSGPGGAAGVCIINTCTVTQKAAAQSGQAIRRAISDHPEALVCATGCLAQQAPGALKKIPGLHFIVDNARKEEIPGLLAQAPGRPKSAEPVLGDVMKPRPLMAPEDPVSGSRARPTLRIQDGCGAFCTYCIVPRTRGPGRSLAPDQVRAHTSGLFSRGFGEVVWTGIHLGSYGRDLPHRVSLSTILESVIQNKDIPRIRLSSLEPEDLGPDIIGLAAKSEKICPHFHIPLQSGDTDILKKMGRPYTREFFADLVVSIKKALPHAAVGVDVLAGFPGETDKAFNNTLSLLQKLPVTYLHVFPYSPRPGTPAARFSGQVAPKMGKKRCQALRRVSQEKRRDFQEELLNKEARICVLGPMDGKPGLYRGITDNYIPTVMAHDKPPKVSSLITAQPGEWDPLS